MLIYLNLKWPAVHTIQQTFWGTLRLASMVWRNVLTTKLEALTEHRHEYKKKSGSKLAIVAKKFHLSQFPSLSVDMLSCWYWAINLHLIKMLRT